MSVITEIAAERRQGVIDEILAERRRQISVEGWSFEHDDQIHGDGKLAEAAAAYALGSTSVMGQCRVGHIAHAAVWPWSPLEFKSKGDRRRNLIKAGALIVAEIERIDRASLAVTQK